MSKKATRPPAIDESSEEKMSTQAEKKEKSPEKTPQAVKEVKPLAVEEASEEKKSTQAEKQEKNPEKMPPELNALINELENYPKIDEKLRHVLGFMRLALSHEPKSLLGLYWKGRSLCLALFKEAISPPIRAVLWTEYLELMQEARRIKEIIDEESSFAVEQIELAIKGLEENLQNFETLMKESKDISFPSFADKECEKNKNLFQSIQKELTLLNSFASRVHALRKEVIQTGMRLKIKNRFFARLSECGDLIFPKRREFIKTLSTTFVGDVEHFVDTYFKSKTKEAQNYVLREEIKSFQDVAKRLTLNTGSFAKMRKELSQAWDALKEQDKERKKEFVVKRDLFRQNCDQVMERIKPFAEKCAADGAKRGELEKDVEEILRIMKSVELSREDVHMLKEELKKAQKPLFELERAQEEERKRQKREQEEKLKEKVAGLSKELSDLDEKNSGLSCEELKQEAGRLKQESEKFTFSKSEALAVEALFKRIEDIQEVKDEEEVFKKEGEPIYL